MRLNDIFEVTVRRVRSVRKGRVVRRKTCAPGYKLVNGRCVRQSAAERMRRRRGAIKGNRRNKSIRRRNQRRGMRLRKRMGL